LAVELEQAPTASLVRYRGRAERQGLEDAQDLAHVAQLGGIERADPKASTHRGVEHAFASQAEQGLAYWRATHPQLAGQDHVPNSATCRQIAALDLGEDAVVDLVPEGYA
jgi:hypothetical protein